MDRSNRKNIAILAFTLIVVMLGYGLIIPLFPFYIEALGASGRELGLLMATSALLELVCGPVWGSISDRTGRKPILLLGVLGYALSSLLFGLSTEIWMLFASRALSGILSSAVAATALAYISDNTPAKERGWGIGMLGAAMGLGAILGPALGGWLGEVSISLPFFVAAGLSVVALVLGALLLPESLTATERQRAGKVKTLQFAVLWQALFGPVGLFLFLLFLVSFGLSNFESVFGLYAAQVLGYGPERVGAILAVVGLTSTLGKALLTRPLTRWWGEGTIIKVSLASSSAGFILLMLVRSYPGVLAATGIFILSKTLLRTVIMSLASQRTTSGQGTIMGLCNSFMNLGRVIGPIWAGFAFDINIRYPYFSGTVVMAIGLVIALLRIPTPVGNGESAT